MIRRSATKILRFAALLAGFGLLVVATSAVAQAGKNAIKLPQTLVDDADYDCDSGAQGSPYIPLDSWIYPAVLRLYSLGYISGLHLNMRPWTRASLSSMLEDTEDMIADSDKSPGEDEAEGIYNALKRELREEMSADCHAKKGSIKLESGYTAVRAISGTPLRDSFHLGSTIVNDYGRPYANGLNNYSGSSGYASMGRFLLYLAVNFRVRRPARDIRSLWQHNLPPLTQRISTSHLHAGKVESCALPFPITNKPPFRQDLSQPLPEDAFLKLMFRHNFSILFSRLVNRTTGKARQLAGLCLIQIMLRTFTRSASIELSHWIFLSCHASQVRSDMSS